MLKFLLTTALLFSFLSFGQTEDARIIVEKLCSPAFQGRGYVNGGDSIAAEFLAAEYKKRGCSFFNNQPFQSFRFPVNTFPGRMELTINGKKLIPGQDFIINEGSCGGAATDVKVVEMTTAQLLETGAIDWVRNNTRAGSVIALSLDGLKGDSLKKASAVLEKINLTRAVVKMTDSKFTWSVASSETEYPLFEVHKDAVGDYGADAHISYAVDAKQVNHTARNIIAYIPSKKKCNKYLVYTAHYDHLGRMGQETYFPGGNDNASGTAMLLELASYFHEHPQKVNVVFMSFAGEEAGLIGSHYYVKHPIFPLEKISFLTNIDIMGSGEEGITVVNATEFPDQFTKLNTINDSEHLLAKVGKRGKAANSDHYFFTEAGVPAFFIYTMGPNKNYHDIYDTYANLSFAEFDDLVKLLVKFAEVTIAH